MSVEHSPEAKARMNRARAYAQSDYPAAGWVKITNTNTGEIRWEPPTSRQQFNEGKDRRTRYLERQGRA